VQQLAPGAIAPTAVSRSNGAGAGGLTSGRLNALAIRAAIQAADSRPAFHRLRLQRRSYQARWQRQKQRAEMLAHPALLRSDWAAPGANPLLRSFRPQLAASVPRTPSPLPPCSDEPGRSPARERCLVCRGLRAKSRCSALWRLWRPFSSWPSCDGLLITCSQGHRLTRSPISIAIDAESELMAFYIAFRVGWRCLLFPRQL